MSFANSEVLPNLGGWFRPLTGRDPYNKKSVDDSKKLTLDAIHVIEQHFLVHTFLVGERITLADLVMASLIARGFEYVLDKQWRQENPNTTRWYETVTGQAIWKAVLDKPPMCEEAVKYTPPKKDAKPAAPKAEAKPKAEKKAAKEDDDEEDEPKPEVKQKHPLEALPKPSLILDDWKRKYSNEETREVALPWFWEHYKPEDYSLWRVDYKYNDELTMTFMSSNLVGKLLFYPSTSAFGLTRRQVVSSLVSRHHANTSSALLPSTASPTTPLSVVLSWYVATRLCQLLTSLQTGRATSLSSSTPARTRTRSSSRTCGLGTSLSSTTARHTNGLMARSSSRLLAICEYLVVVLARRNFAPHIKRGYDDFMNRNASEMCCRGESTMHE